MSFRGAPRQCQNEVLAYELPAAVSRAIQNVLAQSILVVYLYTCYNYFNSIMEMCVMPDNKYGKKAFKYSGLLRSFFAWPLYIGVVLIIICAILYETKNNVRNSGVCIQLFSGSEATFV